MKIQFAPITNLTNPSFTKLSALSGREQSLGVDQETLISDTTGFHIYGDLHLTLELSAATEQDKANLYLEVLEDYAMLASRFANSDNQTVILEVQGERIHLFHEAGELNPSTYETMIDFCSYLTKAVYKQIKPKVEKYWGGFCMAADFGRAIVLATGRNGDDSLVSLGNVANAPAKRLSRSPQVKAGYVAVPTWKNGDKRGALSDWTEVEVKDRALPVTKTNRDQLFDGIMNKQASASDPANRRRSVALFAKSASVVSTVHSTVDSPSVVQAFILRADLDGFTARVNAAFERAKMTGSQEPIKELVLEFLQIMKLPDAFEKHLGHPLIRLPWAGDCYNAIFLPRDDESYEQIRKYLPALISLRWQDPDGEVNSTRPPELQSVARGNAWAIGIAGGEISKGRLLVANIPTLHRRFLVVGGWGARRSLDAHNADGLRKGESALHQEDHSPLNEAYKEAFRAWSDGPTEYRKATAKALKDAENKEAQKSVHFTPRVTSAAIPAARPYYAE